MARSSDAATSAERVMARIVVVGNLSASVGVAGPASDGGAGGMRVVVGGDTDDDDDVLVKLDVAAALVVDDVGTDGVEDGGEGLADTRLVTTAVSVIVVGMKNVVVCV